MRDAKDIANEIGCGEWDDKEICSVAAIIAAAQREAIEEAAKVCEERAESIMQRALSVNNATVAYELGCSSTSATGCAAAIRKLTP